MATFRSVILKGKRDIKRDGTTNIKIRILHKNKPAYISTELFIFPSRLNRATGFVESGNNYKYVNISITQWLLKCQKIEMELGDKKNLMSAVDIKDYILNKDKYVYGISFYEYVDELMKNTKSEGTAGQYRFCMQRIKAYAGPILYFSDINLNFLLRFEAFLFANGARNGIINYMTTFRAIFNKARDFYNNEDTGQIPIPHYPFRRYTMPKRKAHSKDHILTKDELLLFMNYKPENKGEEFAQDLFMLMFYLIGIESVDLFNLPKAINGRIFYDRFKTGKQYSINIEPPAHEIINKYAGEKHLLSFPEQFTCQKAFLRKINNYLHGNEYAKITGIFQRLGIHKNVTTKWARHTWATFARNDCRIDKDDVALCLGHEDTDNQVTDMYIKYDYTIIDDSNRKVIDFIHC